MAAADAHPNRTLMLKATNVTATPSKWMFQPKGILEFPGVPSGDCYYGELFHDDRKVYDYYVFSCEVRVKDWVFMLSQPTPQNRGRGNLPSNPNVWFVVGYHKEVRCIFRGLEIPPHLPEGDDLEVYLVAALFEIVGPVFYGNVAKDDRGGLSYSHKPLSDPLNDPKRLCLTGGPGAASF